MFAIYVKLRTVNCILCCVSVLKIDYKTDLDCTLCAVIIMQSQRDGSFVISTLRDTYIVYYASSKLRNYDTEYYIVCERSN